MSRKIFPGAVSVLRDRLLKGVEPVVLLLVAQLLEEADLQMAAIKLLVAIEQMHLQQRHRDRVHRRSPANAGHPRAEALTSTAKMPPSGGGRRNAMLAVGNPRARPSFAPCATRPLRVYGCPSSRSARRRSPAPSAPRTAELDTRSPSNSTSGIASTGPPGQTPRRKPWQNPPHGASRSGGRARPGGEAAGAHAAARP